MVLLGNKFLYNRFKRVLTVVYNTPNYWAFVPYPSSGIQSDRKCSISEMAGPEIEISAFQVNQ
jgi:hypothetical protein